MDIVNAVRERIEQLCEERYITLNKLANISAIPPSTLKNIMYGASKNPKILTVKMLCDGLNITLTEFFNTPVFNNGKQYIKTQDIREEKTEESIINTVTAVKYRILQLCESNHIAIYKLEELTSVPTVTINNILYGRSKNPKLLTIKIICDGLGITLAEFFDTDDFNHLEQEIK